MWLSFYTGNKAYVEVNDKYREWFVIEMGERQACVMSPWLFSVFKCVLREVKMKVKKKSSESCKKLSYRSCSSQLMLIILSSFHKKGDMLGMMKAFVKVCRWHKLDVDAVISKLMVTEIEGLWRWGVNLYFLVWW